MEHVAAVGVPAFVQDEQMRMVRGSFDLSLSTFYPALEATFQYNEERCAVSKHPLAQAMETCLAEKLDFTTHQNSIQPIFVSSHASTHEHDNSSSLVNRPQNAITVGLVEHVVVIKRICAAKDVLVLAMYSATMRDLVTRLNAVAGLDDVVTRVAREGGVAVSTVDACQGKERKVVFLTLGTTLESGPGFAADPRRLNLAITRQSEYLVIVGDDCVNER